MKLRATSISETEFEVDETEYFEAKAAGRLDHFLDSFLSDMDDTETVVIEPDGTEVYPYE